MTLRIVPCTHKQANAYVEAFHRHSGRTTGHLFSMAVADALSGLVHGVAITGRPIARLLQDGATVEVLRNCTDGTFNACSILYAHSWQTARAAGYWRAITYIRDGEAGASLKAAGWRRVGATEGGSSWASEGRPRESERQATERWEVTVNDGPPMLSIWPESLSNQPELFVEA